MKLRDFSVLACSALVFAGPALANDELMKLEQDANQWVMPTGDYSNHRFSTLKQITAANIKNLRPVWSFSTGALRGHEGQPLVVAQEKSSIYIADVDNPGATYSFDLSRFGSRRNFWSRSKPSPRLDE